MKERERYYTEQRYVWEVAIRANMRFYGYEVDDKVFDDKWEIPQEYVPDISIKDESGNLKRSLNKIYEEPHEVMYENGFKHFGRQKLCFLDGATMVAASVNIAVSVSVHNSSIPRT